MASSLIKRFKKAWNVFANKDPTPAYSSVSSYYRPDRYRLTGGNERSIVNALYNRISIDAASIDIKHIRTDDNGRYLEDINSDLNNCLSVEANIDQTARAFKQDMFMSLLDEGCVAVVPVVSDMDPNSSDTFKIYELRTGKITQWYPDKVRIQLFNEQKQRQDEIIISKSAVAIIENPFYSIMNESNSTMQRLIRKLNLLDAIDEQSGSGKLDLIIQLPYVIKTEARKQQAEKRRKDIEDQLAGSKYGIAYTDGTEHITQLNRPTENNLMHQIEYLTSMLYSQLGITQEIMNGTANEETMLNYYNRTIEPLVTAITSEMKRKFLTKTARSQYQTIAFFRDPFKLVPVNTIAEIADKFTRNEIMTSNEIRQIVGMKPSKDPAADELRNKNLNQKVDNQSISETEVETENTNIEHSIDDIFVNASNSLDETYSKSISEIDKIDSELDSLEGELGGDIKHYASEYYDPQKAHEYYEEHKKLKGRRSVAGLNEKGRAAAKYVRDKLNTEKKGLIEEDKEDTKDSIDTKRNDTNNAISLMKEFNSENIEKMKQERIEKTEAYKEATYKEINNLRSFLKGLPKEQRAAHHDQVYSKINELRDSNRNERRSLMDEYNSQKAELNEQYKAAKNELRSAFKEESNTLRNNHRENSAEIKKVYDETYENELDKIRQDSEFISTKKRRR